MSWFFIKESWNLWFLWLVNSVRVARVCDLRQIWHGRSGYKVHTVARRHGRFDNGQDAATQQQQTTEREGESKRVQHIAAHTAYFMGGLFRSFHHGETRIK